jgi:glycosyltransferase involved in cell wall biosynthesis
VIAQLEKVAFIFADHVLVVYEEELSRVERYASGVTKTKLGVDYETFADPPEKILNRARAILGEKTRVDAKTIIYVGGLEPPYHIPTVIEAMDHLDGWQFVVLGDGEQRDIVEQADSNRADVFYLGTVDHELIPGFLHESDVGISLVDDRNTLKLLEYGAARLPTVNVEGDAEAKFDGLVEFCSLNPTDVARGIENAGGDTRIDAFQEFTEGFGWAAIATEYEKALCSAVPDVKESNTPPDDR